MVSTNIFFKNFRRTKHHISNIRTTTFETTRFPSTLNETFISLIPKTNHADKVGLFWSISLCNTIYKICTKLLANRIKKHLNHIISLFQSAFLKQQRAANNIIVAQEHLQFARKPKTKTSYLILKLDMEKAFDRLEWSFIKLSLEFFNFPDHFIR